MKATHLFGIFLVFLCTFSFISCNDDERADKKETITMLVSSETSTYLPLGAFEAIECMLFKEENQSEYTKLDFFAIAVDMSGKSSSTCPPSSNFFPIISLYRIDGVYKFTNTGSKLKIISQPLSPCHAKA